MQIVKNTTILFDPKEACGKKQGQYGLVIYGLSSIHDAKINNNIELLKTQQYYLIRKILAQIWRTLKRKISATCCFTTRYADFGGERGIRTPGTSQYAGFQDRCIRPLCHLSMGCVWLVELK